MAKKKRWYNVVGRVVGSKYLGRFLALSPEEATEMALESEAAYVGMCHQCSDNCEDPEIEEAFAELDENQNA